MLINWVQVCHPSSWYRRHSGCGISTSHLRHAIVEFSSNQMITNSDTNIENVIFVAPGGFHCLGLQQNGNVVAWGSNAEGQSDVPVNVHGITAISAGHRHSLALTNSGRVMAWGSNRYGQASVPDSLGDVVMITAGRNHNVALRSNGTVYAWGNNKFGQCSVPDLSLIHI